MSKEDGVFFWPDGTRAICPKCRWPEQNRPHHLPKCPADDVPWLRVSCQRPSGEGWVEDWVSTRPAYLQKTIDTFCGHGARNVDVRQHIIPRGSWDPPKPVSEEAA